MERLRVGVFTLGEKDHVSQLAVRLCHGTARHLVDRVTLGKTVRLKFRPLGRVVAQALAGSYICRARPVGEHQTHLTLRNRQLLYDLPVAPQAEDIGLHP